MKITTLIIHKRTLNSVLSIQALALALLDLGEDLVTEPVAVAMTLIMVPPVFDVEIVLDTLEPVTRAGRALAVVQIFTSPGHTYFRSKSLSSGPMGPDSYLHETPRFKRLSWRGSL